MLDNIVGFEAGFEVGKAAEHCVQSMKSFIEEYNEPFELLVVKIVAGNKVIRILTGYGPQENWDKERRLPFFRALEEEVIKAANAGRGVIIELDSNSNLGAKYIPKDPYVITPNGKLLSLIIDRT